MNCPGLVLLEQMCRACMCCNQNFHSLYDKTEEAKLTNCEMFANALPQLNIQSSDELPKNICYACVNKLIIVHEFQQMCVASDKNIRNILRSNKLKNVGYIVKEETETPKLVMAREGAKLEYTKTQYTLKSPYPIKVETNDEASKLMLAQRPEKALAEHEGYLTRKHEWKSTKKMASYRSWDKVYMVAKAGCITFYQNEKNSKTKPESTFREEPHYNLQGAVVEIANDYTKRKHVFRIRLPKGAQFLLQAYDDIERIQSVSFLKSYSDPTTIPESS